MNDHAADPSSPRTRPWLLVWLAGAIVPILIGAVPVSIWVTEAFYLPPPNRTIVSGNWWDQLPLVLTIAALVALPISLIATLVAAALERRKPRTLAVWALVGLLVTLPGALLFVGRGLAAVATVLGFGVIGSVTAWRVRRGRHPQ
ncbi:hypothetical protein [Sphingomonas sp.]|uniref:hypothetical protein n=1 Tax=Sphingomonas sp. TaxID=28214 RepID=UPI001B0B39FC|nr:hypothetical protein [Sphingomonas sp.]MBO9711509.1 hypothetical protein [Sphingomonas sp.]